MIWSDWKILENQEIITPFNRYNVQPNSYDVTLGDGILVETEDGWERRELPYLLKKGDFILATTAEYVKIPNGVVSQLIGKSTRAREGVVIENAGFIDSGFNGNITLEMTNFSLHPFRLERGMHIGQIVFFDGYESSKVYGDYGNHYQGQVGTTPARR